MTMTISGDGSITGLVAGGLPDATITQADLATGVAGTGPAFSAYASATQSFTANAITKIVYDTEEFDTNNNFASSRFTPTVAGYYQINASFYMSSNMVLVTIYKNGSAYKRGQQNGTANALTQGTVSSIVYCNGSTDYIEVYGYSSATQSSGSGIDLQYFNGSMVRAA